MSAASAGTRGSPSAAWGVQRIARQGPGTVRHPVEISRPHCPDRDGNRRRLAATKDAVVGKEKPRPERVLAGASPGNLACDGGPPLHEHFTPSDARESTAPLVRYGRPRSSHPLRERRRWPPGAVLHSLSGFKCLLRVRPKTSKSVRRTKLSSLRRGRQEEGIERSHLVSFVLYLYHHSGIVVPSRPRIAKARQTFDRPAAGTAWTIEIRI